MSALRYSVVVPSIGRPSLAVLIDALAAGRGPRPAEVLVVDDRVRPASPLLQRVPAGLAGLVRVLAGPAAGPAAARNTGWRAATSPWVAFLDDDVVPAEDWAARLADDVADLPVAAAGSQGRIEVPRPRGRRPTDWERNVAGLESACWATADLAYRREALVEVGGFDERFGRAYREDADLGLRITQRGGLIVQGERMVRHPVRPAPWWISVRLQAGNADDVLMRALHGPDWRVAAAAPPGRLARHAATTGAGLAAVALTLAGRRRTAIAAVAGWVAGTAELAWRRIAPGPRTPAEVAAMVVTSVALPPVATWQRVRGRCALAARLADTGRAPAPPPSTAHLPAPGAPLPTLVPVEG